MKYAGAVFFDSDGTITDDTTGIILPTEKTLCAVEKLKQNGFLTSLCTGRALPYTHHTSKYFDGVITSNGTYGTVGDELVADFPMDSVLVKDAVDYMNSLGVIYTLDNPRVCYCSNVTSKVFLSWIGKYSISASAFSGDAADFPERVYKMSVLFKSAEQAQEMTGKYKDVLNIDLQPGTLFADVSQCGYGKGAGVKAFTEHFDIPFENTYAFGDSANDVSMLSAVAHGIAMGRHADCLDGVCEFVTQTVANEGIEFGLKHYNLI